MKTRHRLSNITALLITGSITVATFGMCTAGNYQFGPYASTSECDKEDAFADYYQSNTNLSFANNSACRPGKMRCTLFPSDIDGGSTLRWSVTQAPLLDAGIEGTQCNGIDDDCNGLIDDIADLGSVCYAGYGACKQVGVRKCPDLSFCSATSIADMGDNKYHGYPFVDPESRTYSWNWGCAPATAPTASKAIYALYTSFDAQRGTVDASQAVAIQAAFSSSSIISCKDPSLSCTGTQLTQYSFLIGTSNKTASLTECGKSYALLKCKATGTTPSCSDDGIDTVIVACQ